MLADCVLIPESTSAESTSIEPKTQPLMPLMRNALAYRLQGEAFGAAAGVLGAAAAMRRQQMDRDGGQVKPCTVDSCRS